MSDLSNSTSFGMRRFKLPGLTVVLLLLATGQADVANAATVTVEITANAFDLLGQPLATEVIIRGELFVNRDGSNLSAATTSVNFGRSQARVTRGAPTYVFSFEDTEIEDLDNAFIVLTYRRSGTTQVTAITPFVPVKRNAAGRPISSTFAIEVVVPEPSATRCCCESRRHPCRLLARFSGCR